MIKLSQFFEPQRWVLVKLLNLAKGLFISKHNFFRINACNQLVICIFCHNTGFSVDSVDMTVCISCILSEFLNKWEHVFEYKFFT